MVIKPGRLITHMASDHLSSGSGPLKAKVVRESVCLLYASTSMGVRVVAYLRMSLFCWVRSSAITKTNLLVML